MDKANEMKFERNGFARRLKSMLSVDFRRLFTSPLFYIIVGVAAVIPVLVLVMTTSVSGGTTVDPITGVEQAVETEPITNTWQVIESASGEGSGMSSDIMSMCNINLLFFAAAVLICMFVTDDFKSGYAKNIFAVRSKKTDYVISKSLVGFIGGAFMIVAYFIGAMLGGAIAGLSFDTGIAGISGIVMCLLSKVLLMAVFVPIYALMSIVAKQKTWMSMVGSFAVGMLLFMMIPSLTPLNSTIMNVVICLIGGAIFSVGLGAISNTVLRKTSLV